MDRRILLLAACCCCLLVVDAKIALQMERPTIAKVVKALAVKRSPTEGIKEDKRSFPSGGISSLSCCYGDIFCVACDQIAIRSADQMF
jgi:hypothetical protein